MAELDRGRASQEKLTVQFHDYSTEKESYGFLVTTSAYDKKLLSENDVDPTVKAGKRLGIHTGTFIYLTMQKNYI